jgi:hypothetical protein
MQCCRMGKAYSASEVGCRKSIVTTKQGIVSHQATQSKGNRSHNTLLYDIRRIKG